MPSTGSFNETVYLHPGEPVVRDLFVGAKLAPLDNDDGRFQAIAVAGIRGRYNERSEFLITTTTAANEASPPPAGDLYFPHIVSSGGYATEFILFNTEANGVSGTIQLLSQSGVPLDWTIQ